MKRRGFLGKMAGGSVVGAVGISAAQDQAAEAGPLVKTPAMVMAPRHDGVEVVWAVSRLAKGRVEWKGEDGSSGTAAADRFGMVPQGDEILRVRIGGLKAGGKYQLRAITEAADGKETVDGPWKKFGTLDPLAKSTEFVVWNDTHQNAATIGKLHELTPRGDFLLWNGDTCNDWHQEDWLVPTLPDGRVEDAGGGVGPHAPAGVDSRNGGVSLRPAGRRRAAAGAGDVDRGQGGCDGAAIRDEGA